MKRHVRLLRQRLDQLWDHVSAGHALAMVPCREAGDVLKVGKRVRDAKVEGWVGFGRSERGREEFVVATAAKDSTALRTLVRIVQSDLGFSAVVGEGFSLTIFEKCECSGGDRIFIQRPFGLSPRIETSPSGNLTLSFEEVASECLSRTDWIEMLEAAYCDIRQCKHFLLGGAYG